MVEFDDISKAFPGVVALDGVGFRMARGSVHALMGENGAGKSTLLKILSGAHEPTRGSMAVDGKAVEFRSTAQALAAGVAVIYQELHLAADLTVAENIFLGHMPSAAGWLRRDEMVRRSAGILGRLGERIDPRTKVSRLPIGQRQMVEIAKALARGARIMAFDEPTSSLSGEETRKLFRVVDALKKDGCAILYVTHRMEEVFGICDALTVLRDGRHVETFASLDGVTRDRVVSLMVGREIADLYNYRPRERGGQALGVEGICGPGVAGPASFHVDRGEILGVFGLVGAGRTELMKLVYGATPSTGGGVRVQGERVAVSRPGDAIRAGIMFCPEDRKAEGIFPVRSVAENINVSIRRSRGVLVDPAWETEAASGQVRRMRIRTPSVKQPIASLSGGNQQKAILARWLGEKVRVMILDEPTRGIDVGARSEVYAIVHELAASGVGVVVVSSDLPEALGISDRLMVMREGAIAGFLARGEFDERRALQLALPEGAKAAA